MALSAKDHASQHGLAAWYEGVIAEDRRFPVRCVQTSWKVLVNAVWRAYGTFAGRICTLTSNFLQSVYSAEYRRLSSFARVASAFTTRGSQYAFPSISTI